MSEQLKKDQDRLDEISHLYEQSKEIIQSSFDGILNASELMQNIRELRDFAAEKCMMSCISCEKEFDIEIMREDGDSNYFCQECFDILKPVMDKEYLIAMYNATSTERSPGSDELESYEAWLERQLIKRISKIEVLELQLSEKNKES